MFFLLISGGKSMFQNCCNLFKVYPHIAWTKALNKKNKWSYLKSSMDPEESNTGRPFGGIGFICKQTKNTTYKILDINSDKICALQIITNQTVVATIVGVYMPFYNGKYEQIEVYIDCLDILPEIAETYAQNAPPVDLWKFQCLSPTKC